jgi:eukaryotic-like serine/threonine-protein kinase
VTDDRWPRVKALFQAAVERPLEERDAFVAAAAGDDAALRREVESLLTSDASDVGFLDQLPVASEFVRADPLAARPASADHTLSHTLLPAGLRVGPYKIVAPLGAGAMGDVYRACDTKLNRDIALKVLPERFALDPDRLARFKREAQLLATLSHSNIAAIYSVEESNGSQALVLELVDGPTLADRIADGPIPLDEALPIARQLAEALEAAHDRGIIHRDLKPANIKIARNEVVKVLDFGLARVWDGGSQLALAASAKLTATDIGGPAILGTPGYMSPEQARGQSLDRRTDLWSFGCVLYEMLTGRAPFAGDSISDTLAAILDREPDHTRLPADTPVPIRRLLRRCLEKDRKGRLDSAAGARLEIDDAIATPAAEALAATPSRRVTAVAIAALAGAVAIAAAVAWALVRPAPVAPAFPSRFAIVPPPAQPLNVSGSDRDIALSPDGRHLVYRFGGTSTAGSPLMVRAIDQLDAQPVANVTRAYAPFFSPDSRWIGFFENADLKKVSIAGGPAITLSQVSGVPLGASWGDDNTITFATSGPSAGLWRVSADGGEPAVLTTPERAQHEGNHAFPSVLPGGRSILFTIAATGSADSVHVAVLDLKTGQRKTLIRGGGDAQYVETGHLIFAAAGALRAVRFDPARLEVLGDPVTVVEHVMTKPSGAANYAVSSPGTLVYMPGGPADQAPMRSLVWVDRKGHEEPINAPLRSYGPPRVSPDGTRLAMGILDQRNTEIWIWDLARETLRRLTFAPGMDGLPVWTPDSRRIIFMSDRTGVLNLYSQAADGSGPVDRLTTSAIPQWPTAITPDGAWLAGFDLMPSAIDAEIVFFPLRPVPASRAHQSPGESFARTRFNGGFAEFSPNGRYVAYQSDESGRMEVYVRPFPQVDRGRWQISTAGGTRPAWARNGGELFYLDGSNTFTVAAVQTSGPTFIAGTPAKVFDAKYVEPNPARHYDVSPDGQRFLMIKSSAEDPNATPASMVVVEHWFEELKQRVPMTGR